MAVAAWLLGGEGGGGVAAWRGWRRGCVLLVQLLGVAAWREWRRGCFAGVDA